MVNNPWRHNRRLLHLTQLPRTEVEREEWREIGGERVLVRVYKSLPTPPPGITVFPTSRALSDIVTSWQSLQATED